MAESQPLLSIVVTSRNDNHGESLMRRMQTFVNALIAQCKRHRLAAELIIVEWNPPPENPPLADALRWPADTGPCQVRIIEVPPELHRRFRHADNLPLFQMIAKNVGVRRARGRFVLCTNIDILFNDELMRFLAGGHLRPGKMYRIDRRDVMTHVSVDAPVEEQLAYCRTHHLRNSARLGTFPLTPDGAITLAPEDISTLEMGVIYEDGWHPAETEENEEDRFRWAGDEAVIAVRGPAEPHTVLSLDLEPGPGVDYRPFLLQAVAEDGAVAAQGWVYGRQRVHLALPLVAGEVRRFRLRAVGGGRPTPGDPRTLNFRAFRVRWTPGRWDELVRPYQDDSWNLLAEDFGVLHRKDVAEPGQGISFCRGFHALEHRDGVRFRWADDLSVLRVEAPEGKPRTLCLEIQPGPSVGYEPFRLVVQTHHGDVVARALVEGWQRVHIALPVPPGQTAFYHFVAENGGRPCAADRRILNFRVLHCSWSDRAEEVRARGPAGDCVHAVTEEVGELARADVARAGAGVRFGCHWHRPEVVLGEHFRWAAADAGLVLEPPAGPLHALCLEVEPGPGVGFRPFELQVRDLDGRTVARGTVHGRQRVHLALPVQPGVVNRFRLHVPGGGRRLDTADRRVMNFRVYHADWSKELRKPPTVPAKPRKYFNYETETLWSWKKTRLYRGWAALLSRLRLPALTRTTGPAAPETATPKPAVRGDIVSPVYLHTNACGDFTLMAREHWFALRGNPELEMYSFNIDSAMCYLAHHGGAPEEMLEEPMRIYHIEHSAGSGWTPEGAGKLMERMAAKGIPVLPWSEVVEWAIEMRRTGQPRITNDENWGLGQFELKETVIGGDRAVRAA